MLKLTFTMLNHPTEGWISKVLLTVEKEDGTFAEYESGFNADNRTALFTKSMGFIMEKGGYDSRSLTQPEPKAAFLSLDAARNPAAKRAFDEAYAKRLAPDRTEAVATKGRWIGTPPSKCDICGLGFQPTIFVDGDTGHGWAIMCSLCHPVHGKGLGTGLGQQYTYEAKSGHWVKTAG